MVFDKTQEKIFVADSHSSIYGYTFSLFVLVATFWKAIEPKD